MSRARTLAPPVLAAALGLAAWAALSARLPAALLPSPGEVLAAAGASAGALLRASAETAASALLGLALAWGLGLGAAVSFLRWRPLEAALYPYALLVQTMPVVAIAPLLVVWLGYGRPVAVVTTAIVCFFPVLTAAHVGLRSTAATELELFALYGASWLQELRLLRLPAALPYLFGGLRTTGGLAIIGAIVGELVGSNGSPPSLGFLVLRAARSADTGLSFAAIFSAAALALGLFGLVRWAERRLIGAWFGRGPR
jgi:NitT/TauT family transport system permease protein